VEDAGPLVSESDARVNDNDDGQCRCCVVQTGHDHEEESDVGCGHLSLSVCGPAHSDRNT